MKRLFCKSALILFFLSWNSYVKGQQLSTIQESILSNKKDFYFIDFKKYPKPLKNLPIGVFDSGTGGLTVLDAIVNFDQYNNTSKAAKPDGKLDFENENFIYLADQANMPYGNYNATGKDDLLKEHIIKDFQFLLANKYYSDANDIVHQTNKRPVKAIVIACNTATAYGYEEAIKFLDKSGLNIPVIGVINAAARGTLSFFDKSENGSIGVFATVGTIASAGYERTIKNQLKEGGFIGNIQIYNQGGHGLAEAVDEEQDYIDKKLSNHRDNYRGPSLNNDKYKIEKSLLDVYNFDFDNNKMLCDNQNTDDCSIMQLNDAENYVRFHLVSLMEKIRKSANPQPLKALILGCTHYPYLVNEINTVFKELRDYKNQSGEYVYRHLLKDQVAIVDPSIYVAQELYAALQHDNLFNTEGNMWSNSEFFISVPNLTNKSIQIDNQGKFTYEYKYGRNAGEIQEYVKVIPFDRNNISYETINRFEKLIPQTFRLIQNFSKENSKLSKVKLTDRI